MEGFMARTETKVPVKTETKTTPPPPTQMQMWRPFETLRHEVDRLFDDFTTSPFRLPFRRPMFDIEPFWAPESWMAVPPVDLVEHEKSFEIHADLPGMDDKDVSVQIAGGVLTIKGEKHEDKEMKKPDFHLRERRFGSFVRSLRCPRASTPPRLTRASRKAF
jgi:HSP20 family protein